MTEKLVIHFTRLVVNDERLVERLVGFSTASDGVSLFFLLNTVNIVLYYVYSCIYLTLN